MSPRSGLHKKLDLIFYLYASWVKTIFINFPNIKFGKNVIGQKK